MAFAEVGMELEFKGKDVEETGILSAVDHDKFRAVTGQECHLKLGSSLLHVDPKYFRPTEGELLIGDPTKAKTRLKWEPKYSLPALVKDMMEGDIRLMQRERYLKDGGFYTMNYFE
jgi:GDPmannose 4,6-dehydratase